MKKAWIGLTRRERNLLLDALRGLRNVERDRAPAVDRLTAKIVHSAPYPDITIGVYGGQVQWAQGNPFPIRICDYDGDQKDLADIDPLGERCRIWFESPSRHR